MKDEERREKNSRKKIERKKKGRMKKLRKKMNINETRKIKKKNKR